MAAARPRSLRRVTRSPKSGAASRKVNTKLICETGTAALASPDVSAQASSTRPLAFSTPPRDGPEEETGAPAHAVRGHRPQQRGGTEEPGLEDHERGRGDAAQRG